MYWQHRLFGLWQRNWELTLIKCKEQDLKAGSWKRMSGNLQKAKKNLSKPEKKPAKVKKYDLYGYVDRIPLRGVRRSIAKAMVKSKYTAPHVTAMDEADVTELWKIREKEKKAAEKKGIKLTILPFIIKAVIAGLSEHPYLNAIIG